MDAMEIDDSMEMYYEPTFENIRLDNIFVRYQQLEVIHEKLDDKLCSYDGKKKMFETKYPELQDQAHGYINHFLSKRNIRIASFLYNPELNIIYKINTIPISDIDILHNFDDDDLLNTLSQDMYMKILINELQDSYVIFSYDIYYNRKRNLAGLFHRDTFLYQETQTQRDNTNGYHIEFIDICNIPIHVSLEFFCKNDKIYLGPELIEYTENRRANEVRGNTLINLLNNRLSHRVLVTDGSVVMFNNLNAIHATPLTYNDDNNNYLDYDSNLLYKNNPHRLGQYNDTRDLTPIKNTDNDIRTFLRTFVKTVNKDIFTYLKNNNKIIDEIDINEFLIDFPVTNFVTYDPRRDLRGGTTLLNTFNRDNIDRVDMNMNNPTVFMQTTKKPKQIIKVEPMIELPNFKIKNVPIKVKLNVNYSGIENKYITTMQQKEAQFLQMLMNTKPKSLNHKSLNHKSLNHKSLNHKSSSHKTRKSSSHKLSSHKLSRHKSRKSSSHKSHKSLSRKL
jgi:hypothetical protein